MNKNKNGYTLIETIIVLAIMAILAGLAVMSIGVIHKAKYNAATNTLNNQMSNLWIQTKSVSQSVTQTSVDPSVENKMKYPMCMQIKRNTDETYSLIFGYDNGTSFDTANQEIVATLPEILKLEYTPKDSAQEYDSEFEGKTIKKMVVRFNKDDGSVKYGAGEYAIKYDGRTVATIYLDAVTGKHYIK